MIILRCTVVFLTIYPFRLAKREWLSKAWMILDKYYSIYVKLTSTKKV
jgi:hypothetical protein